MHFIFAGDISILALGPLSNLGIALSLDNNLMDHINNVFIMGGSVSGVGNISPNIEFNFAGDPDAASITLSSCSNHKAVLFPWETVLKADTTMV